MLTKEGEITFCINKLTSCLANLIMKMPLKCVTKVYMKTAQQKSCTILNNPKIHCYERNLASTLFNDLKRDH